MYGCKKWRACIFGIVLLVVVSLVLSPSTKARTQLSPTPTPKDVESAIYIEPTYGISFRYPRAWYVYPHFIPGRHRGFDPVLITSFEIPHYAYGTELIIPHGEAALLISFEGNDLHPTQELTDYVSNKLASIFYQPTGRLVGIGGKDFVELSGDTGQILVTSKNTNVYSTLLK